jgi:hypothetical protein
MEFANCVDSFNHERCLLSKLLYKLSDELHILVSLAKNAHLLSFILHYKLSLFLCNSDYYNPLNHLE